jgi:adenosine deaminase
MHVTSAMDDTEAFSCALAIAAKLPKVELHLHLDGSLLPSFIRERAKARGIEVPETDRALRDFVDEMKGQVGYTRPSS